ncbi:hypothetical protein [Piscinibacter terrae]|uniref:Uncharacterized protein n=1 Tax=Piscinibacter terrae TaxID=2496871 RepID=A0A3N7HM34_9BURK|nr:hypothetical protein [Albitalea terrae]RQP21681.1 hypothetical protein DZC73_27665 [Albitalea terrae]
MMSSRALPWLISALLAALALAAPLLQLSSSDPIVMALAMLTAMWLAWVTFDHSIGPLRDTDAAPAAEPPPGFVDTQATWKNR